MSDQGKLVLAKASSEGFKSLGVVQMPAAGRYWTVPAFSRGARLHQERQRRRVLRGRSKAAAGGGRHHLDHTAASPGTGRRRRAQEPATVRRHHA